jgi:hypothetical protein
MKPVNSLVAGVLALVFGIGAASYLVQVKAPEESKYPWDYFKILKKIPGEQAFRPLAESECPLVKKS